ncbi:uncharacterized protein MONOS_7266 [Monocercomonoides exilis]|uniref:uncharacterized protein n=1 Tax=Monocercomonoides exilis TaxID=2049356 RepID=UPI003559F465|nr:hypothetical protein MONOS_7266 [Monocercomonoides exilis]|eukprot:MONOS_7266.1-p1 / transcript=MONOS_7266.1 / gene=MONOS_7266 / organism=Monocercomonoides_exilis_PA203 / gene_product=unspecified product / transcript_product=unspecified product / location=Mono_scaffold00244:34404-35106(+) / protein_length=216 / sequence_SO=supercontig / SO=protein_coding / is_pseudo=false
MCEVQISLAITLMNGNHTSETTTIDIGSKKISVIGKDKDKSSIGTGALSSTGALFSVSTGNLGLLHMKIDCSTLTSPSPSVAVVTDGDGSLSLGDVVITTSVSSGNYVMSSSVFVVVLSQLSMDQSPSSSSSSSSSLSSLSSSALYLTATASGDSVLANVKVMNVKFTSGDGVVAAKAVEAGKSFSIRSTRAKEGQNLCALENGDSAINFCLINF